MDNQILNLAGQLGASGIFAIATVIIAKAFYQHYEEEIKYLRAKIDALESKLSVVQATLYYGAPDKQKRNDASPTPEKN